MRLYTPIQPNNKSELIKRRQSVKDIVIAINRAIKESRPTAEKIAPKLVGRNRIETLQNIFNFIKQIPYKQEPSSRQTARTLPRILSGAINGVPGDCKHYTIAVASLLEALDIPYNLRLISQNYFDSEPTHIYVVAYVGKKPFIIDCVLRNFNNEAAYKYKYDV